MPVLVLLMHLSVCAQMDPKKLDSLSKAINSSAKVQRSWQDSFVKVQDSIYHASIEKKNKVNTSKPDQFIAERNSREVKQRQQRLLGFVIVASLLTIAVSILIRRRKT